MIVPVVVEGQSLRWYGRIPEIADNSIEFVQLEFRFPEDWDNMVIVAQFTQTKTYNCLLVNNRCFLPMELVAGPCEVSVFGYLNEEVTRGTTIPLKLNISRSGFVSSAETPIPPTPDLYAQLIEYFSSIAGSGGGGSGSGTINPEDIAAAVEDYLSKNPPEVPDLSDEVERAETAAQRAESANSSAQAALSGAAGAASDASNYAQQAQGFSGSASDSAGFANTRANDADAAASKAEEAASDAEAAAGRAEEAAKVTTDLDITLTQEGKAADAKAVGDAISKLSGGNVDLTGYATEKYVKDYAQPKGEYLTAVPDGYAKTEDIPKKPEDIGAQPSGNYALKTEIPSVPVQSVNGKTGAVTLDAAAVGARPSNWMPTAQEVGALPNTYTPPNQTAEQVGADPKGTASSAVSQHNTAEDSHNDIRLELKAINDRLTAFFDSDNQTLDELSEIVAYITNNKTLIESITTSKVNVADIINNLTTNVSNKPLSAAQGFVLKGLIDTLSNNLANYQPKGNYLTEETDPTVPAWAKKSTKPSYSKSEVGLGNVDNVKQYSASNPPPYPVTSVNGKTGAVTLDIVTDAVRYVEQTLTEAQKAQARQNIGARNVAEISPSTTEEELAAMYADGIRLIVVNPGENLIPSAIAQNGAVFHGCGYLKGYRLTSSGDVSQAEQAVITGFIPYVSGKTIKISGALHREKEYGCYLAAYNSAFDLLGVDYLYDSIGDSGGSSEIDIDNNRTFTIHAAKLAWFANAAYIRISLNPCMGRRLYVWYV